MVGKWCPKNLSCLYIKDIGFFCYFFVTQIFTHKYS